MRRRLRHRQNVGPPRPLPSGVSFLLARLTGSDRHPTDGTDRTLMGDGARNRAPGRQPARTRSTSAAHRLPSRVTDGRNEHGGGACADGGQRTDERQGVRHACTRGVGHRLGDTIRGGTHSLVFLFPVFPFPIPCLALARTRTLSALTLRTHALHSAKHSAHTPRLAYSVAASFFALCAFFALVARGLCR
jgi:hypothetical protein